MVPNVSGTVHLKKYVTVQLYSGTVRERIPQFLKPFGTIPVEVTLQNCFCGPGSTGTVGTVL